MLLYLLKKVIISALAKKTCHGTFFSQLKQSNKNHMNKKLLTSAAVLLGAAGIGYYLLNGKKKSINDQHKTGIVEPSKHLTSVFSKAKKLAVS